MTHGTETTELTDAEILDVIAATKSGVDDGSIPLLYDKEACLEYLRSRPNGRA